MRYVLVLIALLGGCHPAVAQRPAPKPNIIIIVSDDHAYQAISAYGTGLMQTPAIDRIAREGVRFDKAYVTNSICGPSRAVLLTGKYSNKNGYKDNETSRFDARQNSFAKELRQGGYQTAWIGKYHLGHELQGFDHWQVLPGQGEYYNPDFLQMDGSTKRIEGYVSTITEDLAESWLDQRDKSRPFCLVIGHKAPHRVWLPDMEDYGRFDHKTFPIPPTFYDTYAGRKAAQQQEMSVAKDLQMGYDLKMFASYDSLREGSVARMNAAQKARFRAYYEPIKKDLDARHLTGKALAEWKFQRYLRDYLSTAASLDRNIGRTLSYLDNHQLRDNTIVIYLSDQGFFMGEHGWFDKRWMYEESFRTPLVMRYPGVVKPGTVSDDLVLNLDLAPTLLAAASQPIPQDMQGESLLPRLTGTQARGRDALYYHYYENGEHAVSPQFGVRTRRYKLIRFYKRVNDWELYDLQRDPREMRNLYGRKGYEKITTDLKKRLSSLIDQYDDGDARQLMADKTANR